MASKPTRFTLISKTTRNFYHEARQQEDYNFWNFLHGYAYARWPYLYIGIGKGDHPIRKKFPFLVSFFDKLFPPHPQRSSNHSLNEASHTHADGYHGKVIPLQTARELVQVKEAIRMPDLEQVVPYTQARAILQQDPDHIVVLDCPCRAYVENPCLPMDVCLIIGEPFASFITEHQPKKSRWITQDEAVSILEAEDKRGHVHHAFFKEAMLGRFYAICNCCECCCGAMMFHKQGIPMLASSGYIAKIDQETCIECGVCHDTCQFFALDFSDDGPTQVDFDKCMGCGICVNQCSQDAIELVLEPEKGYPLEIKNLINAES
jgi:Pyruvate/2-oxoacid:ferredoxin oxidoreductase delta subunit